ncbi:hypothetical protein EYF80_042204 [Liparis tanakae]|uniref:Uncharacterized protein n=1 Tax=Liparis tanakae TaxID=230148 RepID=A0A4Z2G2U5_9TELE|nr:hypothetical protein EYF80_042204 [Liparis tanakae]
MQNSERTGYWRRFQIPHIWNTPVADNVPAGDASRYLDLTVICNHHHVLHLQQLHDAQLALRHREGVLKVTAGVVGVETAVVEKGVEGQAVPPTGGEVLNVDAVVTRSFPLTPDQQRLLRRAVSDTATSRLRRRGGNK